MLWVRIFMHVKWIWSVVLTGVICYLLTWGGSVPPATAHQEISAFILPSAEPAARGCFSASTKSFSLFHRDSYNPTEEDKPSPDEKNQGCSSWDLQILGTGLKKKNNAAYRECWLPSELENRTVGVSVCTAIITADVFTSIKWDILRWGKCVFRTEEDLLSFTNYKFVGNKLES